MREPLALFADLIVTIIRLMGPGCARSIVAENLLFRQQLLVLIRTRQRAPRLSVIDRFLFDPWLPSRTPRRLRRAAVILKPSTLFRFHAALVKHKYHLLYAFRHRAKPGPKGPS